MLPKILSNFFLAQRSVGKSQFLAIAMSISAVTTVVTSVPIATPAQSLSEIQKIAREVTVKIDATNPGSGVIVAKKGTTYYVLTAKHVVESPDSYTAITSDGKSYPIKSPSIQKFPSVDLAIVTFVSDRNYRIATLSKYLDPIYERRNLQNNSLSSLLANQNQPIFISGFPNIYGAEIPKDGYVFNPGMLTDTSGSTISDPSNRAEGYRLIYTNLSHEGMSGGAVLDANARIIGIHGRADGQKIAGDQVVARTIPEARNTFNINLGQSLGVPIRTFLTLLPSINPELKLNVENTPPRTIPPSKMDTWVPPQQADKIINPIYWINRGNQFWRIGQFKNAQEAFEKAIQLNRELPQAWYAKGFIAGFERNYQSALENCQKAVNLAPKSYDAWRCKAGAEYRLGKLSAALTSLDEAIRLNRDSRSTIRIPSRWRENPIDYTERGEILFGLGRSSEAIASFDKAIEVDEQANERGSERMAAAWSNRGFVQIMTQDLNGAEVSLNRALAIDPNLASAWANRGMLLHKRNLNTESLAAFDRAVALNSKDPEIWVNRAVVLLFLQQDIQAEQSVQKALEIDPKYAPAQEINNYLKNRGRKSEAKYRHLH
jgi:tetratricopeptide (TPR) repeat protein